MTLEHRQRIAEIVVRFHRLWAACKRLAKNRDRIIERASLRMHETEVMQAVEVGRIGGEHSPIRLLGLLQSTMLMHLESCLKAPARWGLRWLLLVLSIDGHLMPQTAVWQFRHAHGNSRILSGCGGYGPGLSGRSPV
jgi:hypothetical protein